MKKLLLFFAIIMFASCSTDDSDSKKGVEILNYEVSTKISERFNTGYDYTFDILVKNHTSQNKIGIINISLDMGDNMQGFNHIDIVLEPNETKEISDTQFWGQHQNGVITHIKFDELD